MAKSKNRNVQAMIPIAPQGGSLDDISPPLQTKVTKADISNVMTINMTEKLMDKLNEISEQREKALNEIQNIAKNIHISNRKALKDNYKEYTLAEEDDEDYNGYNQFTIGSCGIVSSKIYVRTSSSKKKHGEALFKFGECNFYITIEQKSTQIAKLQSNISSLNKLCDQIREKVNKLSNSKYARAQIDTSIIASMPNGKQVFDRIQEMTDQLSNILIGNTDKLLESK